MNPISCQRYQWSGPFDTHHVGTKRQHPADGASWIWAEGWHPGRPQVVQFTRRITLREATTFRAHLTADQRFQLRIDGQLVATGPDRSDVAHWTVASYEISLPAGQHEFSVLAWWLPDEVFLRESGEAGAKAPLAQMTWRGGFLFAAEGAPGEQLTTGIASWNVTDLSLAVRYPRQKGLGFHVIGPAFEFDLAAWNQASKPAKPIVVLKPIFEGNLWGTRSVGWRKHPATLPEQRSQLWNGGTVRATRGAFSEKAWVDGEVPADATKLVQGEGKLRIPAATEIEFLWDFEEYHCGYPVFEMEKGQGARVHFDWAEALYETPAGEEPDAMNLKGNRAEIDGKRFLGFGDSWVLDGKTPELPALWWRSGRYARVRIRTDKQPLVIKGLALRLTGYPIPVEGRFACDDPEWMASQGILLRGLEMSAHETWVDCPYYEQISYVGDDVTDISLYTISPDARLTKRCIQLFDWSRRDNDFVGMRAPGGWASDSATYAMLYPRLAHDYLLWRDDPDFAREVLPGLRSLTELFIGLLGKDGLVGETPGWPFTDWVDDWLEASSPGEREGDSSLLNLHFVLALQLIARVERAYGETVFARRSESIARDVGVKTKAKFWNAKKGLLADDSTGRTYCEHAQSLGILSGILGASDSRRCLESWLAGGQKLAPASIYFSYYSLEAFYQLKAAEAFHSKLGFWKGLRAQGFCTTPERPEPSRSDCHGWGSHPLFHNFASIAGIRPTEFGFSKLRIAPMPGPMRELELHMPHPRGQIAMKFSANKRQATVQLPKGLSGEFVFAGKKAPLKPGANKLSW